MTIKIEVDRNAQTQQVTFDVTVFKTWDEVLAVIEEAIREGTMLWHARAQGGRLTEKSEEFQFNRISFPNAGLCTIGDILGFLNAAKRWAEFSLHCGRMQEMQMRAMQQAQQAAIVNEMANNGGVAPRRKLHL